MSKIFKVFQVQSKAIDQEAGIYEVTISTEDIDRDGDIVRASGAQLENYMRNPVVLLGHDYHDLPVGKTLELRIVPGVGICARFQFPEKGLYDKADQVRALWDAGFLNAASIGFNPLKSINLDPQKPWGPQEYIEWELLEWSIVTVPANQDALRLALNASDEKRLRAILAHADTESTPSDEDDGKSTTAESSTGLTSNNENEAKVVEQVAILLQELFEVKQ